MLERGINIQAMDVTQKTLLPFLKELLDEVKSLFPDNFIHLGGDEVAASCWRSVPHIAKVMQEKNIDTAGLQALFTESLLDTALPSQRRAILWEESLPG